MKKEKSIEDLRKKAHNAAWRLKEAEEKLRNETLLPELRKMVGKCFRYTNSYGGDYQKWPLFVKVLSLDEKTFNLNCVEFQRTSLDIVEIKLARKMTYNGENTLKKWDYVPIKAAEYNRAKRSLKKFINEKLDL